VGWFKLVGSNVLVGRIPFLRDQFSDLQNLVGASHIRSAPSQPIIRLFIGVSSLFIRQYDFSTIYWQVQIFLPAPKKRQDESRGTIQKYYYFIYFLFLGDLSLIRGCRKHEGTCFKINRACFYCPLGLEIIGCSNKGL